MAGLAACAESPETVVTAVNTRPGPVQSPVLAEDFALPADHPPIEAAPQRAFATVEPPSWSGPVGPGVDVDLLPPPELPLRPRKRLNVDQLRAAIERATGGVTWSLPVAGKPVDQLQALERTLGKPDYADATQEDLTPSALFQKFLLDAALHACQALVVKDQATPQAQRTLFVHAQPADSVEKQPAAVDLNLRYLLLRYHGRQLHANAPELQGWRFLLQTSQKAAKSGPAGWQAVCVGLMAHPRFYTY